MNHEVRTKLPSVEHEEIVAMMAGGLGLEDLSVVEQRAMFEATAAPVDADVAAMEVDVRGVPAEWISIEGQTTDRVVLYFHGGAYVMGSTATHRSLAGRIARASNARVLLPNYRLAPENPFPAALDDALTCWNWLVSEGYSPERMAIAGDSAGGGLGLATLLALKDLDNPLPACAVGLSPWTDLEGTGPTAEPGAVDDPMLTAEGLRSSGRDYAASDLKNPLAAPLWGNLEGLPPLLLQVGTREILLSDSTRFADKARQAGVDVTLEVEEGLVHVWQILPGVPEAQSAVDRIGAFIAERC